MALALDSSDWRSAFRFSVATWAACFTANAFCASSSLARRRSSMVFSWLSACLRVSSAFAASSSRFEIACSRAAASASSRLRRSIRTVCSLASAPSCSAALASFFASSSWASLRRSCCSWVWRALWESDSDADSSSALIFAICSLARTASSRPLSLASRSASSAVFASSASKSALSALSAVESLACASARAAACSFSRARSTLRSRSFWASASILTSASSSFWRNAASRAASDSFSNFSCRTNLSFGSVLCWALRAARAPLLPSVRNIANSSHRAVVSGGVAPLVFAFSSSLARSKSALMSTGGWNRSLTP